MDSDAFVDGSPIDRAFYQVLLGLSVLLLLARGANATRFLTRNRALFLYFAYFGLSVLWSDYSFVAFKRWTKDAGNLVIVLLVLSERDPVAAVKTLLVRAAYVVLPLSVVLNKYYPEISRTYFRWSWEISYFGVATNKNMLGMALVALGLSVLWALLGLRSDRRQSTRTLQLTVYAMLLLMDTWLLYMADSATAIVCTVIGAVLMLLMQNPAVRRQAHRVITVGGAMILIAYVLELGPLALQLLGRDASLTGRTDIWKAVLAEDINPLIGAGFYSFWIGDRAERVSSGYYFLLNEAHNGYLEIYLNGGVLGLALFMLALWLSISSALRAISSPGAESFESFRLTIICVLIVYNFSEAIVSRLNVMWFAYLLVACVYRPVGEKTATGRGERRSLMRGHRVARSRAVERVQYNRQSAPR